VSVDVLIREAVERAANRDDRFIREVEKGLAQIDAGQVLTRDAVSARPGLEQSWPSISSVADGTPLDPRSRRGSRANRRLFVRARTGPCAAAPARTTKR
jgi:hypothetical protein